MHPSPPRAGDTPPPFRCASRSDAAGTVRIEASGELDLATAPELERSLRDALADAPLVLLDLHEVGFIDTSGLHVIEDAAVRALLRGRRVVVERASARVAWVVELAGLAGTVDLVDVDRPSDGRPVTAGVARRRPDRCPPGAAPGRGACGP